MKTMSRLWKRLFLQRAEGILLLAVVTASPSWAGSKLFNVQGKLTDGVGNPLAGVQTVIFRLYASTGVPVSGALWTESRVITPQSGLFNVTLGNMNSLDALPFNTPYYLGIQVASDPNELTPRQLLGASSYALGSLGDFNVAKNVYVSSGAFVSGDIASLGRVSGTSLTVSTITPAASALAVAGNIAFATPSGGVVGTKTSDSATAGNVGEYISSSIGMRNCAVPLAWGDLTSITLTPGDWVVSMLIEFYGNGANVSTYSAGISAFPGNSSSGLSDGNNYVSYTTIPLGGSDAFSTGIAQYRVSLAATTTYYLKYRANYAGGTAQAAGRISATRVR